MMWVFCAIAVVSAVLTTLYARGMIGSTEPDLTAMALERERKWMAAVVRSPRKR